MIKIDAYTWQPSAYKFFKIQESKHFMPAWFKEIPPSFPAPVSNGVTVDNPTMKSCPGLTDLYTKGIILPLWSDIVIQTVEDRCRFAYADNISRLDEHVPSQMGKLRNGHVHAKLVSNWALHTDSEVDFLWVQPSYNLNKYFRQFHVLPGIVNYKYQHGTNVNIMMEPNTRIEIPAGTPLAHIIPFTDEPIEIEHHLVTQDEYSASQPNYPSWTHSYYKEKAHDKKQENEQ